ncbi:Endonuclease/exonuclease/phosphatase [Pisolithus thermaeus]|nr:Endonuclease/exonuclease/phosphatase [Pisolithus thermaeus]
MDVIRVATLNCWGLKYVSKNRHERIAAIADAFSNSDHDIVALQELWVEGDYNTIQRAISHRLPHAKRFLRHAFCKPCTISGALGAGLAIFTKWPIVSTNVTPYSLNGEPIDVVGGDWFVGKAVGSVTIMHPILGRVQVFNTHFYAKGGESGPEYKRAHRLVSAWEFAKVVRQAAALGNYVIAMGDFNSVPNSLPMHVIFGHAGLFDAWTVCHTHVSPPSEVISPVDGVVKYGITADSPLNSYRGPNPSLDPLVRMYHGKRLDYILFRQPSHPSDNACIPKLECQDSKVIFTTLIPGNDCSFSDHFGVEATFVIGMPEAVNGPTPEMNSILKSTASIWAREASEMSMTTFSAVLGALQVAYRVSQGRSRRELVTFALCILALLVLMFGSMGLAVPWANPILVLFTIAITWLATTMLYEGFLFGNWERRALRSTLEELELHKQALAAKYPQEGFGTQTHQ